MRDGGGLEEVAGGLEEGKKETLVLWIHYMTMTTWKSIWPAKTHSTKKLGQTSIPSLSHLSKRGDVSCSTSIGSSWDRKRCCSPSLAKLRVFGPSGWRLVGGIHFAEGRIKMIGDDLGIGICVLSVGRCFDTGLKCPNRSKAGGKSN